MLQSGPTLKEYSALRRDFATQRPSIVAIAERHGLTVSELRPFAQGTHLVWHDGRSVVKVFCPLWARDADVELRMLRLLACTDLPVPQLEQEGVHDGWTYVVMSQLDGDCLGAVWEDLPAAARVSLSHQIGETTARFNALPTDDFEDLRADQDTLLTERVAKLRADQIARGGSDELDAALERYLAAFAPPAAAESVLLHADLTSDHFLVRDGRIIGLIDFADAFVGPWTYEFAAPAAYLTRGLEDCERAMLSGYGVELTPDLARSLRSWIVLHRYSHIAIMMREAGAASLRDWLAPFWAWLP